jgi:hypothetical protein
MTTAILLMLLLEFYHYEKTFNQLEEIEKNVLENRFTYSQEEYPGRADARRHPPLICLAIIPSPPTDLNR